MMSYPWDVCVIHLWGFLFLSFRHRLWWSSSCYRQNRSEWLRDHICVSHSTGVLANRQEEEVINSLAAILVWLFHHLKSTSWHLLNQRNASTSNYSTNRVQCAVPAVAVQAMFHPVPHPFAQLTKWWTILSQCLLRLHNHQLSDAA